METKRQRDKAAAARAQEESEFVRMMEADPDTVRAIIIAPLYMENQDRSRC